MDKVKTPLPSRQSGNAMLMLFAAVGMAGVVTYGLNNIIRGPAVTTAEVSRRTIAENNLVATTRLAIAMAAKQGTNGGDCDSDGFVEPLEYRDAGSAPKPTNGGLLPMTMGASMTDPWGTQYGYCVWDPGTVRKSDNDANCGGSSAKRLDGAFRDDQPAIAVISAGKDGIFQTTCAAFDDTGTAPSSTANDNIPDTPMITKGGDDIVLSYTYAEANGIGGGLWKLKPTDSSIAQINRNIQSSSTGGAKFDGTVELKNKGLVLPGDPGDNTVTGVCDEAKDGQMRRNTSGSPPTIEMCDFTGGTGWTQISGSGDGTTPVAAEGGITQGLVAYYPFKTSASAKTDASGNGHDITTGFGSASEFQWAAAGKINGSALGDGSDDKILVPDSAALNMTSYSITAWVRPNDVGDTQQVVNKWDGSGHTPYWMILDGSGLVGCGFSNNNAANYDELPSQRAVPFEAWSQVTCTVDNTAHVMKVYINGVEDGSITTTGTPDATSSDLAIGYNDAFSPNEAFSGNIDEVRIYNRALSAQDIGTLYVQGVNGVGAPKFGSGIQKYMADPLDVGLVSLWHFDEAQGATAYDSIGGNNATLTGTPAWHLGVKGTALSLNMYDRDAALVSSQLGAPQNATVAAWVNIPNPDVTANEIVSVDGSIILRQEANTSGLTLAYEYGSGQWRVINSGIHINGTGWHYLAGTLDTTNDIFHLYLDGIDIGSATFTDAIYWAGGPGTTAIGRHPSDANFDMHGDVDEVRFYNRALGPREIADLTKREQLEAYVTPIKTVSARSGFQGGRVAASDTASCSIKNDGTLWCWGSDANGQLGNGTAVTGDQVSPTQVVDPYRKVYYVVDTVSGVTDGGAWSNALTNSPVTGSEGIAFTASQTLTGYHYTVSGTPGVDDGTGPRPYSMTMGYTDDADADCILASFYVGRTNAAGTLQGSEYQLGASAYLTGSMQIFSGNIDLGTFAATDRIRLKTVWQNTCGAGRTLTLSGGGVYLITPPTEYSTWTYVSMGLNATCGVRSDGTGWCWGVDTNGQLGNGPNVTGTQVSPSIVIDNGVPWTKIDVGNTHTCGLKANGTAWCWGANGSGQIGNGASGADQPAPVQVGSATDWIDITAGNGMSCGVRADGSGYCWGYDTDGRLGNGPATSTAQTSPSALYGPGGWLRITANDLYYGACGVKADGSAWCWGSNPAGGLGNNAFTNADSPQLVRTLSDWAYITPGKEHTCGIKNDGSLWCWGNYANGRLGTNSIAANQPEPVQVGGIGLGVAGVAAGDTHTCALKVDGSAWCWGADANGRLGNGAGLTADQYSASTVPGFPSKPDWYWNDAGAIIMAPYNLNLALGSGFLSDDGTSQGFGFVGAGRAVFRQNSTDAQLTLETSAATSSSQLSFKTSAVSPTDYTTNLVGKWMLDNTANATVGSSVNGTLNGSPAFDTRARIGTYALVFDGIDDYVQIPRSATVEEGANITLAFWVKRGYQLNNGTVISKIYKNFTAPTLVSYSAGFTATDGGRIGFATGYTTGYHILTSNSVIPPNKWTYVVLTYSPGGSAPQKNIYINGILDATATETHAILYDTNSTTGRLYLGTSYSAGVSYLVGAIDDMRIYNAALTQAQITQLYNYQTSLYQTVRSVGIDHSASGNFEIGRNVTAATNWLSAITPDLAITTSGNVGIGTATPASTVDVTGSVKIGTDNTCDSNRAGAISYTGSGFQYCNGTSMQTMTLPTPPLWNQAVKKMEMTSDVACYLRVDGSAYCWGDASLGQLGNNQTSTDATRPVKVHDSASSTGWNDWTQISVGGQNTCGLRSNGTAWCWGDDEYISVGDGVYGGQRTRPVSVQKSGGGTGWSDWVQISAGNIFNCGIRSNGTAWCWGFQDDGQLGNNVIDSSSTNFPVQVQSDVSSTGWNDWVKISAGASYACGIRANGTAWCWGSPGYINHESRLGNGQYGTDKKRPVQVQTDTGPGGWSDWTDIQARESYYTCGVRRNGTAWCWGRGNMGNGSWAETTRPVQVQDGPSGGTTWTDWVKAAPCSGDCDFGCGLRANGTLWCWGDGNEGHMGNGQTNAADYPVQVQTDTGPGAWSDWVDFSVGEGNVCGVRTNGTVWCWGNPESGRVGDGQTSTDRKRPVQVY